ncbi:hypothetical protein EB796_004502 [Bugula neritina]|uniref:Peptidase C14A caspase catalytic domain-containing protein n=1 Tax=Bugula neritina TaxID=10212 RepID=A0A7J7KEX9_BUGNE|nr:hypothetical protein EB796_004502 [Bugula neritina]
MELTTEKQQQKFKADLRNEVIAPGTKIFMDLHQYNMHDLHGILRKWNNPEGQNFLMLAIIHDKENAVYDILDILHIFVTVDEKWTEETFVDFLCETDRDHSNVLQLALHYQRFKQSDLLPKTLLKYAAVDQSKLAKLVHNENKDGNCSVNLAFNMQWDKNMIEHLLNKSNLDQEKKDSLLEKRKTYNRKGRMIAIIIYNHEENNERNARSLDVAFRGRGFYVEHWQHLEWNAESLQEKLKKFCQEQNIMEQLWVLCLTHGVYEHILDTSNEKINIERIGQTITNASDDEKEVILIIDACQVEEGEEEEEGGSENNITTPNRESPGPSQTEEVHILITCSRGEEAWGSTFIDALVEQLNKGETDVFTILKEASEDTKKNSVKYECKRRKQTIQNRTYLQEGDITLPLPTALTQN